MNITRKVIHKLAFFMLFISVALLSVHTNAASRYTETKYPIVLVSGIFGFDDGVFNKFDYFYKVAENLERSGAEVYTAGSVSGLNSSEVRGEQLAREIEDFLESTGHKKVNLIGHSHGGPTIRYVASVYPEMVASATSVSGVNWGTPVADFALNIAKFPIIGKPIIVLGASAIDAIFDVIFGLQFVSDKDALASFRSLSTKGALEFNAKYPEGMPSEYCGEGPELAENGVRYYSWSGNKKATFILDPLDAVLVITGSRPFFRREFRDNDGLVSSCSSHLGRVIKDDYRMNHYDTVNQFRGKHSLFETDPITVYRTHVNRLKKLGL